MKLCVKKDDIANGRPRSVYDCPIACALKRGFDTDDVIVSGSTANVKGKMYALPVKARKFILLFDDEKTVEPFCFTLSRK